MGFVGLDKMSLLDYEDKVACVVFSQKCDFRCPFCHNGDLITHDDAPEVPWSDIITYLNSRKGLIDAVVFTGGEVTLVKDLLERMQEVKSMGFLVKLDTNGTFPELVKKYIDSGCVDYIAMDIKNSPAEYAKTCGLKAINLEVIKKSIDIIMNSGIDYEFRTTLVEELHSNTNFDELGELIKGAKKLFLQKFVDRDGCLVKGLHEIKQEDAEKIADTLRKYVEQVELRGY